MPKNCAVSVYTPAATPAKWNAPPEMLICL